MAYIMKLPTFKDASGSLTVVENFLPFDVQRFYYIYDVKSIRGGHRHKKTKQALISLGGSCKIYVHNGDDEKTFVLDSPGICLILEPQDWHTMDDFSEYTTLLVFASELYTQEDYISDKYE